MKSSLGMIALLVATVPSLSEAKTVALWPMEPDLRNLIDSRQSLTLGSGAEVSTTKVLPWQLPPNPDQDRHLAEVPNKMALWSKNSTGYSLANIRNQTVSDALCSTSTFTIEGWINIQDVPANNGWYILVNANGGNTTGGWIWSMRRQKQSNYNTDFELYVKDGLAADTVIGDKSFANPAELTDRWMHIALTHQNANASGKSEWMMYTNGVFYGSVSHTAVASLTPATVNVEFGGRSASTANRFKGGLDYWRISDRVLKPEEFLCAEGVSPSPLKASATVHYWKLDCVENGMVNGTPQVGTVALSGGFPEKGKATPARYQPCLDQAFADNPPNSTVTLPNGNCGCFYAPDAGNQWQVHDLGKELEVSSAFTVEGWFKPERSVSEQDADQYIFNTHLTTAGGWAFGLHSDDSGATWKIVIFAQQADGTILQRNVPLSGDVTSWADWKHVALTYDPSGANGNGVWICYLDGVESGRVANDHVPTTTGSQDFHIGGRPSTTTTFRGYVDCVRVSRGALNSQQLLCAATNPQSVSDADVLAFWPLDVLRGAYLDGRDLTGKHNLMPDTLWNGHMAAASPDAPVIANPDQTVVFAGSPTNLNGSVAFNTPENGNVGQCGLSAYSSSVAGFFSNRSGWTAECYVKRSSGTPAAWEILLGSAKDMTLSAAAFRVCLSYRSNGFVLYDDDVNCHLYDVAFSKTSGTDLPEGEWTHVAWTFRTADNKGIYEVFVNGVSKGTVEGALSNYTANENVLVLGGRFNSANSFKGNISSLRLSSRVLPCEEFLNAAASVASEQKRTTAYWPLDFNGSAIDAESRVMPGASFSEVVGALGLTERAVTRVPNPDSSEDFIGNPKSNAGCVGLSGVESRLTLPVLGLRTDLLQAFTVEGWFKWADAAECSPRQVIVGTYRQATQAGWCLYIDKRGTTPCARVQVALPPPYTSLLDAVVASDISAWAGRWVNLVLTYDPHAGSKGLWKLWVNGKDVGTAENAWAPKGVTCSTELFGLGGIPAGGQSEWSTAIGNYDLWRLSDGALNQEDFLYRDPFGLMLLLR